MTVIAAGVRALGGSRPARRDRQLHRGPPAPSRALGAGARASPADIFADNGEGVDLGDDDFDVPSFLR